MSQKRNKLKVLILVCLTALTAHAKRYIQWYDPSTHLTFNHLEGGDEAIVCYGNQATGDFTIPSEVTYQNKTYPVTSIDNDAFSRNKNLTSITVPGSIATIGNCAFNGCTSLSRVTLEEGVAKIGGQAFAGCSSLTSITIPQSVNNIGRSAFSGTTFYENLTNSIDEGPCYWDGWLLLYKVSTTVYTTEPSLVVEQIRETGELTIEPGTRGIATDALPYSIRQYIRTVILPEGLLGISDEVFKELKLTDINIPSTVTGIGASAFESCAIQSPVSIPQGVIDIGSGAFSRNPKLPAVNIAEGVKTIGDNSFSGCRSLTSITIPSTATSIGSYAFSNCEGLTSINIPSNVRTIGDQAFNNCSGLTQVAIEEGVTKIGDRLFSGCSRLANVNIPSSVTNIGLGLMDGTTWYENQPDGLLYLNHWLIGYKGEKPAGDINIKEDTRGIADKLFSGSYSATPGTELTGVTIPSGVKYFGMRIFDECSSLTNVTLEEGLTVLGKYMFSGCTSLKHITLPSSLEEIPEGTFSACSSLTAVSIPNSVTSIGSSAFHSCTSLTNVTLEEGLTVLGKWMFWGCTSLKHITLPSSLKEISQGTFYGCTSLTSVVAMMRHGVKCGYTNVFNGSYETATLFVPKGALSLYKNYNPWPWFTNIVELDNTLAIGPSGQSTFCSQADLDFADLSGLKAYIVTGYEADTKTVWLTRVNSVPANTPVLVEGNEGQYEVPLAPSFAYLPANLLKSNMTGTTMNIAAEEQGYTNYLLSEGKFHPVATAGGTVASGKCYLQLPATLDAKAPGNAVSVTIAASGKSSFCASVDLDFSSVDGLKAYTATGYDKNGTIWMSRVTKASKGTALMLEGTGGKTYTIPSQGVQTCYVNMFKGNITGADLDISDTDGGLTNYLLKDGRFHPVAATGGKVANGKCYLQLPTDYVQTSQARSLTRSVSNENDACQEHETKPCTIATSSDVRMEDESTGINEPTTLRPAMGQEWYSLQGQRVGSTAKGLLIGRGKKIVVR